MNGLPHIDQSAVLLPLIVNGLIQTTLVLTLTLLLARTVLRYHPAMRYGILRCVFVYLLFSPILICAVSYTTRPLISFSLGSERSHETNPARLETDSSVLAASEYRYETVPHDQPAIPREEGMFSNAATGWQSNIAVMLAAIWGIGVVMALLRFAYGRFEVSRLRHSLIGVDARMLDGVLTEVRSALKTGQLPPIMSASGIFGPIVMGIRRPIIVLPEGLLQRLEPSSLKDVLIHECAHVLLHHPLEGMLQRVVSILFWPHPLVHLLGRELAQAREEICDNYVLEQSVDTDYARTLLMMAQGASGRRPAASLSLLPLRFRLEQRIVGLVNPRRDRGTRTPRWQFGVALAVCLLLSTVVGVQGDPTQGTQIAPGVDSTVAAPQSPDLPQAVEAAPVPTAPEVGKSLPAQENVPSMPLVTSPPAPAPVGRQGRRSNRAARNRAVRRRRNHSAVLPDLAPVPLPPGDRAPGLKPLSLTPGVTTHHLLPLPSLPGKTVPDLAPRSLTPDESVPDLLPTTAPSGKTLPNRMPAPLLPGDTASVPAPSPSLPGKMMPDIAPVPLPSGDATPNLLPAPVKPGKHVRRTDVVPAYSMSNAIPVRKIKPVRHAREHHAPVAVDGQSNIAPSGGIPGEVVPATPNPPVQPETDH